MVRKLTICCLTMVLIICSSAMALADIETYVLDNSGTGIFQDVAGLEQALRKATDLEGAYFIAVSTDVSYGGNYDKAGRQFCYQAGVDYQSDDIVMIAINMTDRTYDLFLWGKPHQDIDSYEIEDILDAMEQDIVSGDYDSAVLAFVDAAQDALATSYSGDDYKPGNPYQPNQDIVNDAQDNQPVIWVGIGLVVALVSGAIFVGIVVARYKLKIKPTNYPLDEFSKLVLTDRRDVFLTRSVITTVISSNNSHGGGGSRGAGGGSRGGGGHVGGRRF